MGTRRLESSPGVGLEPSRLVETKARLGSSLFVSFEESYLQLKAEHNMFINSYVKHFCETNGCKMKGKVFSAAHIQ
jgi:hypothetical protein